MRKKQLKLLKLLLEATRGGQVKWKRDNAHSHHTVVAGSRWSLRFKHPLLAGDNGSDADAVEVSTNRVSCTYYCGSEGFDLVGDILSAAYPDHGEHNRKVETLLAEAIEKVRRHAANYRRGRVQRRV